MHNRITCRKPGTAEQFLLFFTSFPDEKGTQGWMYLGDELYRPLGGITKEDSLWQPMVKTEPPAKSQASAATIRSGLSVQASGGKKSGDKPGKKADLEVGSLELRVIITNFQKAFAKASSKIAERKRIAESELLRQREEAEMATRGNFMPHPDNCDFGWCRLHKVYEFAPLTDGAKNLKPRLMTYSAAVGEDRFAAQQLMCVTEMRDAARKGEGLPIKLHSLMIEGKAGQVVAVSEVNGELPALPLEAGEISSLAEPEKAKPEKKKRTRRV